MRKFMKYHGVNIDNQNGLPVFKTSPEAAMAGMPDGYWNFLIDPGEVTSGTNPSVMNRVTGELLNTTISSGGGLGSFPAGEPAFLNEGGVGWTVHSDVGINPESWSVFFVTMPGALGQVLDVINSIDDSGEEEIGLRIGIRNEGTGIVIYDRTGRNVDAEVRLDFEGDFSDREGPSLVLVTFSTERGLSIWDNGVEVAVNADDKRPLSAQFGKGEWQAFRHCRGRYGLLGQLNVDLGQSRNAVYRRMIERHVAEKYDISAMQGL